MSPSGWLTWSSDMRVRVTDVKPCLQCPLLMAALLLARETGPWFAGELSALGLGAAGLAAVTFWWASRG